MIRTYLWVRNLKILYLIVAFQQYYYLRINKMVDDNEIVLEKIILIIIDDNTIRSSKAQILGYGRFFNNSNTVEQFLFCKKLKLTITETGEDTFDVVNNYFEKF